MTRYEELNRKADQCILAGYRCFKNDAIDMAKTWYTKAFQLHEKANMMTIQKAEENFNMTAKTFLFNSIAWLAIIAVMSTFIILMAIGLQAIYDFVKGILS